MPVRVEVTRRASGYESVEGDGSGWWSLSRFFFFFQAEDGIRDLTVTGVQTCALPISVHVLPLFRLDLERARDPVAANVHGVPSVGRRIDSVASGRDQEGPGRVAGAEAARVGDDPCAVGGRPLRAYATHPAARDAPVRDVSRTGRSHG